MGGEVTGMGIVGLGSWSQLFPHPLPPPLVCTLTLEALRGESPTRPHLAVQARDPAAASRQK